MKVLASNNFNRPEATCISNMKFEILLERRQRFSHKTNDYIALEGDKIVAEEERFGDGEGNETPGGINGATRGPAMPTLVTARASQEISIDTNFASVAVWLGWTDLACPVCRRGLCILLFLDILTLSKVASWIAQLTVLIWICLGQNPWWSELLERLVMLEGIGCLAVSSADW